MLSCSWQGSQKFCGFSIFVIDILRRQILIYCRFLKVYQKCDLYVLLENIFNSIRRISFFFSFLLLYITYVIVLKTNLFCTNRMQKMEDHVRWNCFEILSQRFISYKFETLTNIILSCLNFSFWLVQNEEIRQLINFYC